MRRSLVILLVVALGALLFYAFSDRLGLFTPAKLPTSLAVTSNANFVKGYDLFQRGDFEAAIPYFKEAIEDAEDSNQVAYLTRFLGSAEVFSGEYSRGIATLKSVADNQNNADTHRAYAIGLMGDIYRQIRDPKITEAIFSSLPYKDFLKEGDTDLAYRKLYEYANSFYPTGGVSYRLALEDFYGGSASTSQALKNSVQALAEEYEILEKSSVSKDALAGNLLKRAQLHSLLSLSGVKESDVSAEELFRRAREMSAEGTSRYMQIGYYHALFLSQKYGDSRSADIASFVAPFADPAYKKLSFYTFFSEMSAKTDPRVQRNVARIAAIDPRFKAVMASLGWSL